MMRRWEYWPFRRGDRWLYPTHAFLGPKRVLQSYLLVQWGRTVSGPGVQLIIWHRRIFQIGFRR